MTSSNWPDICLCLDEIAFDWTNCLISYKKNTEHKYSNVNYSQEQSWPSGYLKNFKWARGFVRRAIFSGQNSQLTGQILFCPGVSAGHFKNYFEH